jgi:hypothetical protein
MSNWAKFDAETDHFVQGYAERLPTEGEIHELILDGQSRHEQVVAAWWSAGAPDPLLSGKRALYLITRPVT